MNCLPCHLSRHIPRDVSLSTSTASKAFAHAIYNAPRCHSGYALSTFHHGPCFRNRHDHVNHSGKTIRQPRDEDNGTESSGLPKATKVVPFDKLSDIVKHAFAVLSPKLKTHLRVTLIHPCDDAQICAITIRRVSNFFKQLYPYQLGTCDQHDLIPGKRDKGYLACAGNADAERRSNLPSSACRYCEKRMWRYRLGTCVEHTCTSILN